MLAVLDFSDYAVIALIVFLFAGGTAAWAYSKTSVMYRLFRMEKKLDLILKHLGIEYADPATVAGLSEEVRKFADDGQKIQAIAVHRKETGIGLKEAKDAVEAYMKGPPV